MKIKRHEFILPGILIIMFGIVFSYIGYMFTEFYVIFYIAIFLGVVISIGGFIILSWGIEMEVKE